MNVSFRLQAVPQDHKLARRYIVQTILRHGATVVLAWAVILIFGLILAWRFESLRHLEVWNLPATLLVSLVLPLLGCSATAIALARQHLEGLRASGKPLTSDWMAARVRRETTSEFDPLTTFDLCAEVLSSVGAGTALGYAASPAFDYDPFHGTMVLGSRRPLRLHSHVRIRISRDDGGATRIRVEHFPGLQLFLAPGQALQAVETVAGLLRERLRQRGLAVETARRAQVLERAALQARLSALQAQVEPHFLFNTLANLKYLIRTDPERAQRMLDSLAGYLQSALHDMRAVSSTLERELALARNYLSLMSVRMGPRLRFRIDAPDDLLSVPMPPAMLISLVENAVKHGLERATRPGTVTIAARVEGGALQLLVHDDGVGFTDQAGQGFGLSNIHERLALLYGGAASLRVSGAPEGGVEAVLTLPLAATGA
jgi:signal transduction histidine kinase